MNKIRVCIDATPLLLRSAGVKTYLYYWIQHMSRPTDGRELRVFPFLSRIGECVHERPVIGRFATYARLALVHAANAANGLLDGLGKKVDVFHASHQLRNPPRTSLLSATIYDLTCWLLPETHSPANVAASRYFAENVMRRAHGLIAISEHTRADAVRLLGIHREKIAVIYPGVAPAYFRKREEFGESVLEKYRLSKPFVLFVGTVEPRKNLATLLDAMTQLNRGLREQFELLVVGSQGWGDPAVLHRLQSGEPGVRYLGYVPESDLPALTASATAFVYPSLYEGFGLPVAQALAAGVPVITSNVSALPEIVGEAALLVDPRSPGEIAAALTRLLTSPALREQLSEKARWQAGRFRWESAAQKSWEFFQALDGT